MTPTSAFETEYYKNYTKNFEFGNCTEQIISTLFHPGRINKNLSDQDWDYWLVVRDDNGQVVSPMFLDIYIVTFLFFCCLVGVPLNLYIAITLIINPHLNDKPRNILQLSLVLCNIFTLVVVVVELVYYYFPSEEVCLVYVSIVDLPYLAFFLNLLLTLIDRHVAITRPLLHRDKVTVRGVIFWLIILNIALALAVNWVHIGGAPLRCEIQLQHSTTLALTLLILFVCCITLRVIDYVKTKQLLPRDNGVIETVAISYDIEIGNPPPAPRSRVNAFPPLPADENEVLSVHVTTETLAKMEMNATKVMRQAQSSFNPILILTIFFSVVYCRPDFTFTASLSKTGVCSFLSSFSTLLRQSSVQHNLLARSLFPATHFLTRSCPPYRLSLEEQRVFSQTRTAKSC